MEKESKKQTEEKTETLFSLDSLRIDPMNNQQFEIKKVFSDAPVRKPNKQEFIRVHPDHMIDMAGIELEDMQKNIFLITPSILNQVAEEFHSDLKYYRMHLAIDRDKNVFVIPAKLSTDPLKPMRWYDSMLEALERAKLNWTKIRANTSIQAYESFEAIGKISEPEWPEESFDKILLEMAFKGKVISEMDHDIFKKLRGDV